MSTLYKRTLEVNIKEKMFKNKVILLYGPRQVGKTTLSRKIYDEYDGVKMYIQCDIPSQKMLFIEPEPDKIIQSIDGAKLVVIDEAQLIENIGTVLKVMVDTYPDVQIIATGSSSFDLANKTKEPLTGRAYEFMLYPLSYSEIAENKGIKMGALEERLMLYGLYPAVVDMTDGDARDALGLIQNNTLYKDIFALENIKKPKVLEELVRFIASSIGTVHTVNSISTKLKVSAKTVERYLDILEKLFVITRLYGFSRNLQSEIKKGFKIYFIDVGLRNSIIQNHNKFEIRDDVGAIFENYFVIERVKFLSNQKKHTNRFYWRTYREIEVDYIEESDGKLEAFECKYTEASSKGLKIFLDEYKEASGQVVHKGNYRDYLR